MLWLFSAYQRHKVATLHLQTKAQEKVDSSYSEYRIGLTTYRVKIIFNSDTEESMEDIINRLIAREIEKSA